MKSIWLPVLMRKFKIRVFGQLIGLPARTLQSIFCPFCCFWSITSNFVIRFGWKLQKCSLKCLLACMGYGTSLKNLNLWFFSPKRINFGYFSWFWIFYCFWSITSYFVTSFGWRLPKTYLSVYFMFCLYTKFEIEFLTILF